MLQYRIRIITHLKLCPATAIHNFKLVIITYICLKRIQIYANLVNLLFILMQFAILHFFFFFEKQLVPQGLTLSSLN